MDIMDCFEKPLSELFFFLKQSMISIKIILNQLSFYGYHGLFQEEKQLGQRFLVDATLNVSLKQAGKTDEMQQSIDYGAAFTLIEQVVTGDPKNLIEAVAEEIAA